MNAASLFVDAAKRVPDRVAFFEGETAITFAELLMRIEREQERLALQPGARAILMLPMSIELYVALLAVLQSNAIAVFIDPWVGLRTIVKLARAAGPRRVIGGWKTLVLRALIAGAKPIRDERADVALITFTTGSSGNPKGVIRTHHILAAQHERLAEAFPAREGDVDLCTFPVFALNNLALGVPTVIPPIDLRRVADADPMLVASHMTKRGVTTVSASPPLFDRLASLASPPPLRRVLTGGAPVTDAQLRAWMRAWPDAEIEIAYGSSEAEPVAHISARERLAAGGRGYLAGTIVAGVRAKIDPMASDGIGELLVAGDHVCREYVNAPAEGEWHRMGDTGWFDEEGRFRIAGRVHSHTHTQLIERAARGDDPRIRNVAAFGVEGKVIVIVESSDDVANDVRARVQEFSVDDVRVTREKLPVDPRHNAKIDYAALKRRNGT
ncbi:MAG TPA: AMP-binding protein [Thermoanaerobaculia bacterium]|nr:AMP-binding protein [Thermoanaerobaculia bacterium]